MSHFASKPLEFFDFTFKMDDRPFLSDRLTWNMTRTRKHAFGRMSP
jgi:hypothetical protein